MSRFRHLARRHASDGLIVLLAIAGVIQAALGYSADKAPDTSLWFAIPATAVMVLPLLARRRFPLAAPLSVWFAATAFSFGDGRLVEFTAVPEIAGLAGAFLLGNLRNAVHARAGLVVIVGGAAIVIYNEPNHTSSSLVFIPLLFVLAWLAGFAVRERADQAEAAEVRAAQLERERETATRLAVAEERARIARELHDIVAHAVSVMVLQVGAVRHNLPEELAKDGDALQDVESTGRAALSQMRRLLGAMRSERDELELTPHPGVCCLEPLLDEIRRTGLDVELHVEGEQVPLPGALDLSAYRIVQEGLTNALKHAHASRADVVVRYRPEELEIEVRDDGRGPSTSDGLGHGLVGIRERVKLYGGEMSAGSANGRGFVLSTRLPLVGGGQ